ncbi:MAG: alpha/beta hydrolase [Anaerolineales bacterium]|jgi:pimeloyl-ACP methyl ester carboxylesterase
MSIAGVILGWVFAILFGLLAISMFLLKNWSHALVLFLLVLLCLPPVSVFIESQLGWSFHPLLRLVLIVGLLFVFFRLLFGAKITSIYKSPEIEAQFMEIYDKKMKEWPVTYEEVYLETQYGKVHVIVSGSEDAQPMLLLHASAVSSWSWKYNVGGLSEHYRTYAIDLIGDAGKSEFTNLDNIMEDGHDQAVLYAEIADKLGIKKAVVVGASEGGFIATNYALHHPERIEKLALLGPMGYSGSTQSVIRITFTQLFPLKPIQDSTFSWAFSDSTQLKEDFAEWFPLIMTGYKSVKVAPLPISAKERQSLQMPVMFIFGERDNLVGNPEAAKTSVQDIPDVRVEIVEAGHLMGCEIPGEVNQLILDFFGRS